MSSPNFPVVSITKPPALTSSTRLANGFAPFFFVLLGALVLSALVVLSLLWGLRCAGFRRLRFFFVPSLPAPGAGIMK
jgi:hypothetical protein